MLRERTARWLRVRVWGLLTIESRLRRALYPPKESETEPEE